MLQKIKDFGESAKNLLLFVLTPLAFLVGYLFVLLNQKQKLKDELLVKDGEGKIKELEGEKKNLDDEAANALDEFNSVSRAYLQQGADPVPGRDPSSADGDSGPKSPN